jgi:hypothetical protein
LVRDEPMLTLCLPGAGIQDEEAAAIKMMMMDCEW